MTYIDDPSISKSDSVRVSMGSIDHIVAFVCSAIHSLLFRVSVDVRSAEMACFQGFVKGVLMKTAQNATASVILTALLYVARFAEATNRPIVFGVEERGIWICAMFLADVNLNDFSYSMKSWARGTSIFLNI
jgi:hypothetical protein